MSDSTNISSPVNLEFLRKEAKAMLKQCRSGDPAALARLRAQLPRLESEVRLADVQHALARESGYASWAELKQYPTKSRPDYTRPGSEGVLPAGFKEWVCSATYTVRPEMLSPLPVGRIYRVMAGVNRPVSYKNPITFADVYRCATAIVKNRVRELRCVDQSRRLHTWIQAHAWFPGTLIVDSVHAFVTVGVLYPGEGDEIPRGERAPTADELRIAGGLTPERFTPETKIPIPEEALVDFDHADRSDPNSNIAMFSYGEYVAAADGLNFEPFVRRAERRARSHSRLLRDRDSTTHALNIVRRQWFCATNPDIAVVHIYFRV